MPALQFAAQAYTARSPQLISQVAINAFVETSPGEAKTKVPVFGTPGLSLFARMGASTGPINGLHIMNNNLFVVSGNQLYTITQAQALSVTPGQAVVPTLLGTTAIQSLCSMADNGSQLVMVDGTAGAIYQPGGLNQISTATAVAGATSVAANITGTVNSGDTLILSLDNGATFTTTSTSTVNAGNTTISWAGSLPSQMTAGAIITDPSNQIAQILAPAFKPGSTVGYFDGYFVFDAGNSRQFFISAINDGTQYSGLDFATATSSSSEVVAVAIYHEQLLVFTTTNIEIWWDAGNLAFPFQRYDAALIARGCVAPYSVCQEDNTVFWMGDDGIYYRLNGFLPQRISTFALEYAWNQFPNKWRDCSAFVLDQEGHKFCVVDFPSGGATYVYDIAIGLWHQRMSYGSAWV